MAEFDVVLEVDTDSLTGEAYRVGDFSGTVTLLVEAQARTCSLAAHVWSRSQSPPYLGNKGRGLFCRAALTPLSAKYP